MTNFRDKIRSAGALAIATIIISAFVIFTLIFSLGWFIPASKIDFLELGAEGQEAAVLNAAPIFVVTHRPTPDPLKAVYLTSWAAGHKKFRDHIFDLIDSTEINAVVIDVKDYTGKISFRVEDPRLIEVGAVENRIHDIKEFLAELHAKNVYTIARISVFQDSFLVHSHPEWAVKSKADGGIWKDFKGVKWLDAGATPVWDYIALIGWEAYKVGFDELNFDYIRFPSDGNMQDIAYTWSNGRNRSDVLREFFAFLRQEFSMGTTTVPISADIFGLTTTAKGDLGIGQILEDALENFDYVAPMVYPSHFAKGYNGYAKPAENPYAIIKDSMGSAVVRAELASTSPKKLRPWLQAFDLGAIYTPAMVRAQIQATYDVGLTSWMLWAPANIYKKEALLPKNEELVKTAP